MVSISGFIVLMTVMSGYFLVKTAEQRVHKSNYAFLVDKGAEELIPDLMKSYYQFNTMIFLFIAIEGVARGGGSDVFCQMSGLFLIGTSLLLRIWTINSLGRYWTMRCIFLPGYPRIEVGPYRYLSCPEYFSRVIDIVGFSLFSGARWTVTVGVILSIWHIVRILRIEKRQLFELSLTPREAIRAHFSKLDLDRSVE